LPHYTNALKGARCFTRVSGAAGWTLTQHSTLLRPPPSRCPPTVALPDY
jgi:hypothetical protein